MKFEFLEQLIKGRKAMPVGTIREWAGQKYVKHADGWVAVSGKHHGKLMGKFKEEATHSEAADKHASEEKQEEALEGPPKDNPREAAAEATEESKEEYVNARDSKFENKGEDLVGSARHRALEWKGLAEAEKDGTADKLITRDKLLKFNPLELALTKESAFTDVIIQVAMQKFPTKPSNDLIKIAEGKADQELAVLVVGGRYMTPEFYEKYKESKNLPEIEKKIGAGEIRKKAREGYYSSFEKIKKGFEEVSKKYNDLPEEGELKQVFTDLRKVVSGAINELREENKSMAANQLVKFHNKDLSPYSRSPNSVVATAGKILSNATKGEEADKLDAIHEVSLQLAEGKKPTQIVPSEKKSKKKFSMADMYLSEADRKGPDSGLETKEQQEKYLLEKSEMRGLQWGNSVTDEERAHHLKYVAESFKDLTDVLGLPSEMGSFNGRLGLAIGARGKGTAMAHYESDTKVINLTRKSGIGSLAHEWGHFFDDIIAKTHDLSGFMSEQSYSSNDSPVFNAMKELVRSPEWSDYRNQVKAYIREKDVPNRDYWLSTREMFARAFEVHIQVKLEEKDRKNTYLSSSPKEGLWPTKELASKLAPKFDKLFSEFAKSEHLKKAMDLMEALNKAQKKEDPPYYVAVVVFDKDKKRILMGKRREDKLWTTPAGGAIQGESPKQAVIREAFEEANIRLKPYQLKELHSAETFNGKQCHCFYAFIDRKSDLHTTNDPDREVYEWQWFKISDPIPGKTSEARLNTINAAKMKVLGLKKSELADILQKAIVSNPEADIDINTAEESQNELAAEDNPWVERIEDLMRDSEFGQLPKELELPNYRKLLISKVDDGIFSGFVQNTDQDDGEFGANISQLSKMTPISMVQALKAKGYLPREKKAELQNVPDKTEQKQELSSFLDNLSNRELHIHLHGDEKDSLREKLAQFLAQ